MCETTKRELAVRCEGDESPVRLRLPRRGHSVGHSAPAREVTRAATAPARTMAHALVRPPSTRPSLGRSIVSRDENECASFGVSRDRRRRLPSPRATDPPSTDHPLSTQALEWTHGFSSALPDSVVNLSTPSSPTRRLAYVAAHTLVVHESDAAPSHADSSSARQFALRGHRSAIRSVRASDDRAVVVTAEAGPDAAVIVWDVHALRPRRTIEGRHPSGVAAADLTPCGRWYATLSDAEEAAPPYEQVVRVWDLHDAASDEPCFVGVTPAEVAHDKQTCVKFNPAAPRELVTNGRTGVAFFVPDDPETSETGRRAETDEETDEETDGETDETEETRKKRAHRARLRAYAPPVRAGDLNQRVADFTSSAFVTCDGEASTGAEGAGRCVTGTAEGDLVVWMAGGVPPGGPGAFEARGMRAGDRRGVKIVRAHAHGAVTHLSVAGGVARTRRGETSALAPASPDADPADTYLVTGGSDGNVRFFDVELRLVAWFDGLDAGGVTSVSFVATAGPKNVEANTTARDARDAHVSAGREDSLEKKTSSAFTAPDFVVATNDSFVFALRSQDFETLGSDEAVARASLVARGATEPAVALAAHPTDPVLCVAGLHGGVWTWNYATRVVVTHVDLTRGGVKPQSRPTCVAYRSDGLGVVVGTRGGELKALDAQTLAETQAMRFTPDAVTRVCCSDDPACAYAAAADKAGGVSLFRLLGPIHEPRDGADPARAFDFVGKHRTHAEETPCVGLAFVSSADGESVELASVGAEGRVARYDVEGSTAEDGVDVLEVSDVALGGEAAGGNARPTAAAFVKKTRVSETRGSSRSADPSRDDSPSRASRTSNSQTVGSESGSGSESESDSEEPHEPLLLVADDHLKLRLVDCETLTCVGVKCAPPYGDAPVTFLAPFGEKRDCFAYACARDVAGVGRLPADGDPAKSMGVVAHPGPVLALVVSEVVVDGDAAEDEDAEDAARGSASARVFTLGGGGVGVGDGDDRGSVISVWRVDVAAARRLGDDSLSTMTSASFSKKKVKSQKSETVAARRTARLLEGGARGALAEAARDAFAFAQLRAQGEDATRDRAVDTRRGVVPVGEVAGLMRALGLYLTEREVNDVAVELRYEAELAGANVPTEVDFDRFLALYVNRRPPRDVGAEDVREAFEIILDGEGDAVSRESLIEMLKTSGEAMSDEELAAVAKALGGEEAGSVENLFPEAVTAESFAENILGFRTVEE